jgi:hypothetical protein
MGSYRRIFGLPGPDRGDPGDRDGWPCLFYFLVFLAVLVIIIVVFSVKVQIL